MKLTLTATALLAVSRTASAAPVPGKAWGITPTTPGMALTNSLMNGFGIGPRDEILEGGDKLDERGFFKDLKDGFVDGMVGFKDVFVGLKDDVVKMKDGFFDAARFLTDVIISTAYQGELEPEGYEDAKEKRGLPHAPDREFCYYERPNNIFVKMPCNSDRPGLHCYLETGKCEVVSRIGPGQGIPNPN